MDFPRVELQLRHSPGQVRTAILGGQLEPFFRRSGWFTQGSAAGAIRWHEAGESALLGKVGYFRAKNFSVFRFRVDLQSSEQGTRAVLSAQHGPFSGLLRVLLYVIGLCMCIVGVVLSYFADKAIQRGLRKIVENLERHLKMWDDAS